METRNSAPSDARPRARRHWSLDDIPWRTIRHDSGAQAETFFYLVASASLMESATDLYTENLVDYFADDRSHVVVATILAAGGIAARSGIAPLRRSRMAGIRLGTCAPALRRRIQTILRYRAGADTGPGDGIALRRRNGHRELLPDLVAGQPRSGARHADPPHRRRRGAALQTFLPLFPEIPGRRDSESGGGPRGAMPATADDRRRRQLYRPQACLQRPASGRTLRHRGVPPLTPRMPQPRARPHPARDGCSHAAEAARPRPADAAHDPAGNCGAGAARPVVTRRVRRRSRS